MRLPGTVLPRPSCSRNHCKPPSPERTRRQRPTGQDVCRQPAKIIVVDHRYFLHLADDKKLARPSTTIALCGIKFFYQHTLQQRWTTLELVRPAPEKKLPVMLSREEVRRILGAVRTPVYL